MVMDLTAVLHELDARKAQMLNLEVRLFVLLLASQVLYYAHCLTIGLIGNQRVFALDSAATIGFTCLLLITIGTNAKMGLASAYLKQLEHFIEINGGHGILWERVVIGSWIFVPGNAFTISAGLVALLLLVQLCLLWHWFLSGVFGSVTLALVVSLILSIGIAVLAWKGSTVDFGKTPPDFFAKR